MVLVELVFPTGQEIIHKLFAMKESATVADLITAAALSKYYPEIDLLPVGIFSTLVKRNTPIKSGDRIEIYRPLKQDPKEQRRSRAKNL